MTESPEHFPKEGTSVTSLITPPTITGIAGIAEAFKGLGNAVTSTHEVPQGFGTSFSFTLAKEDQDFFAYLFLPSMKGKRAYKLRRKLRIRMAKAAKAEFRDEQRRKIGIHKKEGTK